MREREREREGGGGREDRIYCQCWKSSYSHDGFPKPFSPRIKEFYSVT
jgi:hypothetical protein